MWARGRVRPRMPQRGLRRGLASSCLPTRDSIRLKTGNVGWERLGCILDHGDNKKSIAHTYATIVGMPKNPPSHIFRKLFERSPPYHVATRWYSVAYVIFVGQFAGGYELEWPECGAFWSFRFLIDRWSRTPWTNRSLMAKRSKKRRIRAILARNPRRPCPQKSRIPWKPI